MRCLCGCGKEAGYKMNNRRPDLNNPKRFYNNLHFKRWQKALLRKDVDDAPYISAEVYDELPAYSPAQRKVMFEMARKGNRFVRKKLKEMGVTSIFNNGVMVQI